MCGYSYACEIIKKETKCNEMESDSHYIYRDRKEFTILILENTIELIIIYMYKFIEVHAV